MIHKPTDGATEVRLAWQRWARSRTRSGGLCQTQEFGFHPEWNADPLKDSKQGCEKSGACFRNPIILVLCVWLDKGPGGEQEDQRGNSSRNDRGMSTQQAWSTRPMLITDLCAGEPTGTLTDRALVLGELVVTVGVTLEGLGRSEACKWGSIWRTWWWIRLWRWVRGRSFWFGWPGGWWHHWLWWGAPQNWGASGWRCLACAWINRSRPLQGLLQLTCLLNERSELDV